MPVVSMFYGIVVLMFFDDARRHKKAHIHVQYQGQEAVIGIPNGNVLAGSLPTAKLRLVLAWIEIHRDELMTDWTLSVQRQPLFRIEPLK